MPGRSYCLLVALMFMSMLLTACWDRKEINDVAFVMGTAADIADDQIRTSLQIALPGQLGGSSGGGGGTSGQKSWYTESKTGETGRISNLEEQESISRLLNFSHRRTMLFGEELARKGLEPTMDVLGRVPQNRLSALILITKGPAYKVQDAETPAERFSSEMLREMAVAFMKEPRTIKHAVNIMLSDGIDLAFPAVSLVESNPVNKKESVKTIKVSGLALFSKNKLVDFVDGDEGMGILWAMGQAKNPEILVDAPEGEGKIVVKFPRLDTKLEPAIKGNDVKFHIYLRATGSVVENQSDYQLMNRNRMNQLEQELRAKIEEDVEKGVRKLQELKADVVGFGKTIYNKKPGAWKRLSDEWYEHFAKMSIEVTADIKLEHVGSVIKPFGRREEALK